MPGKYAATIEIQTQSPLTFAVQQTKGKDTSLWVSVTSYDTGDPTAVYAANLPVVGEENGGTGTAGPFAPTGDTAQAYVWAFDGNPFDPVSPILTFVP